MAVRVERSLHRYIEENKEFLIQVQMSSDLEAATDALRLAAEDVAALDGGWESAFGLSPGDANGPTGVGVQVAPHGPVLGVDRGHTPDELLATIPSLIVRRLQEAGVTKAVLARPKQSETLVHVRTMPHAVVLHVFAAPLIPWYDQTSANDAKPPDPLLNEACSWLTAGVGADHELWALVAPLIEVSVPAAQATAFLGEHGGLLVAGRPPSPVPSERAKAERWDEEQRRLDSIERIGGRIRCATTGNRSLTLAFGGPEASEHDLIDAVHQLREVARRLGPHTVYAFVNCEPTFEVVAASSLHYLWSQRGYARGAGSYRSSRPTYPRTIIDDLVRRTAGARVVELGAGTGILTAELVIRGSDVVAVEPVEAMRQALIQDVGEANVREGTAEAIPVRTDFAGAVIAAQSFL